MRCHEVWPAPMRPRASAEMFKKKKERENNQPTVVAPLSGTTTSTPGGHISDGYKPTSARRQQQQQKVDKSAMMDGQHHNKKILRKFPSFSSLNLDSFLLYHQSVSSVNICLRAFFSSFAAHSPPEYIFSVKSCILIFLCACYSTLHRSGAFLARHIPAVWNSSATCPISHLMYSSALSQENLNLSF